MGKKRFSFSNFNKAFEEKESILVNKEHSQFIIIINVLSFLLYNIISFFYLKVAKNQQYHENRPILFLEEKHRAKLRHFSSKLKLIIFYKLTYTSSVFKRFFCVIFNEKTLENCLILLFHRLTKNFCSKIIDKTFFILQEIYNEIQLNS